ncbi:MAG: ROK family protein [Thermoleophilia bacterium]
MRALGIDVGGTRVKAAVVDVTTGRITGERWSAPTPRRPTADQLAQLVEEAVDRFHGIVPIGIGFPGMVVDGVAEHADNLGHHWEGVHVEALFELAAGRPVTVLNDADAAGLAEARFGAARDVTGVVVVVTLGTGVGSALIVDGRLVPNTELGMLHVDGAPAGDVIANRVRKRLGLSWRGFARRLDSYVAALARVVAPDLVVVGGGASNHHARFLHRLTTEIEIVPAALRNDAGIVGAAMAAAEDGRASSPRPAITRPRP